MCVCVFVGCEGLRWKRKYVGRSDAKVNLSVHACVRVSHGVSVGDG